MKKTILYYALAIALLLLIVKTLEYKFLFSASNTEFYVAAIALAFTIFGVWLGLRMTKPAVIKKELTPENIDREKLTAIGISDREYEILEQLLLAKSNQELADDLHISISTVKTHLSHIYEKLDVKSRSQAIVKAKGISAS